MSKLVYFIEAAIRNVATVAMVLIVVVMLGITFDIITRFSGNPVSGVIELNRLLVVILIFLSVPYAQQIRGHIDTDIVTRYYPRQKGKVVELTMLIMSLTVFMLLCIPTYGNFVKSYTIKEYSWGSVPFVTWPTHLAIFLGLCLLNVQLVIQIGRTAIELIDLLKKNG